MSDEVFQRYSGYYDLLYRDKNYAAEAEYVARTLRAVAPAARTVLERYFFPQEVALLAGHAGFQVEHAEEFLSARAPSEATWGVAYILRKTN
ncbi:MAG: hypothetical protein ABSF95_01385 [Verrucomicrobiota bacterium]|jgi:hypothetical protein